MFSQPYRQLKLKQLPSFLHINIFVTYETLFLCFVCPQWIVFVLMSTTLSWIILIVLFTYCFFKLDWLGSVLVSLLLSWGLVFLLKEQFLALFVSVLIKTVFLARKMYDVIIFMIHHFFINWVNCLYWLTLLAGRLWLTWTWLTGCFFYWIISYQVKQKIWLVARLRYTAVGWSWDVVVAPLDSIS